jgi:hypothetical protein
MSVCDLNFLQRVVKFMESEPMFTHARRARIMLQEHVVQLEHRGVQGFAEFRVLGDEFFGRLQAGYMAEEQAFPMGPHIFESACTEALVIYRILLPPLHERIGATLARLAIFVHRIFGGDRSGQVIRMLYEAELSLSLASRGAPRPHADLPRCHLYLSILHLWTDKPDLAEHHASKSAEAARAVFVKGDILLGHILAHQAALLLAQHGLEGHERASRLLREVLTGESGVGEDLRTAEQRAEDFVEVFRVIQDRPDSFRKVRDLVDLLQIAAGLLRLVVPATSPLLLEILRDLANAQRSNVQIMQAEAVRAAAPAGNGNGAGRGRGNRRNRRRRGHQA